MKMTKEDRTAWNPGAAVLGVALLLVTLLTDPPAGLTADAWRTFGIVLLMATWWVGQAAPIAITALVPLVAFPMTGIVSLRDISAPYANPIIFLVFGGFLIARALERWNVHKRIAIVVLSRSGTRPGQIIGGVMTVAALLSMWISNTATTALMVPIGLSIIALLGSEDPDDGGADERTLRARRNFAIGMMLGIAYGASAGGLATIIGTPTIAVMAAYVADSHQITVKFTSWMMVGLPVSLTMLALAWLVLTRVVYPVGRAPIANADRLLAREAEALGPLRSNEVRVLIVFGLVALFWIGRPLILLVLPGLPISDVTTAVIGALLLFLVPAAREPGDDKNSPRRALLTWDETRSIPWGLWFLVGGGLALAHAMDKSGLARQIGDHLPGCADWGIVAVILIISLVVVFLTEVTTNLAITAILLPVVGGLAGCGAVPIMMLAAPVALAAGCAFMMPIATPPNAIVFGSGYITIGQMIRAGFLLNIVSTVVVTAAVYFLVPLVF